MQERKGRGKKRSNDGGDNRPKSKRQRRAKVEPKDINAEQAVDASLSGNQLPSRQEEHGQSQRCESHYYDKVDGQRESTMPTVTISQDNGAENAAEAGQSAALRNMPQSSLSEKQSAINIEVKMQDLERLADSFAAAMLNGARSLAASVGRVPWNEYLKDRRSDKSASLRVGERCAFYKKSMDSTHSHYWYCKFAYCFLLMLTPPAKGRPVARNQQPTLTQSEQQTQNHHRWFGKLVVAVINGVAQQKSRDDAYRVWTGLLGKKSNLLAKCSSKSSSRSRF